MNEEEIVWLEDKSPVDPLADAIYGELHFQRYGEYLKLGTKLRKLKRLDMVCNEINIDFELDGKVLKIEYLLPNNDIYRDFKDINLKPGAYENTVEEQLLLGITQAETNALLYIPGSQFKLYPQASIGFGKQLTFLGKLFFKLRNTLIK